MMEYIASIHFLSVTHASAAAIAFVMLALSLIILVIAFASFSELETKRIQKKKESVESSSEWLRAVKELNGQIHYYEDILGNGCGRCSVEVNSKAKFDKTNPSTGLYEAVRDNRDYIENTLDHVNRNRVIDEMYQRNIERLRSAPTEQQCRDAGVTMEQFLQWEQELVDEVRLQIPVNYTITCFVTYTSPQGRNHYSKHKTIGEDEIRELFRKLDSETTLHASEAWRRKTERAKVTPAVRFRIIQRDGGRCCLCGRSARDGVELEVDHIVPVSRGGDSRDSNLQTLCRECNRGKGSMEYSLD